MTFALSTHWNAYRHASGESMAEEILALGFDRIELGYDTTLDLVPGVQRMVRSGALTVDSVHGVCPVPVGVPQGHPGLFPLTSPDFRVRRAGVLHAVKTADFALEMGARIVVLHAGRVEMKSLTGKLIDLYEQGRQYEGRYDRVKMKLVLRREKKVQKHLDHLHACLDEILPAYGEKGVKLALENLPSWESIPSESEMLALAARYNGSPLAYWHDIGHGQVRENLGLINQPHWLAKLSPYTAGFHVHDVVKPAQDHLMPPRGDIDFARFREATGSAARLVLEPYPGTPQEQIRAGARFLRELWGGEQGAE